MYSQYRRQKLLVDRQVQITLLLRILGHWAAAAAASFLFLFVMQVFGSAGELSLGGQLEQMWSKYGVLMIVIGCLTPVFLYDTLKLTHKFAGPMVSFKRALKELADGQEIAPVKFRDGDHWQDLAVDLNKVAERLKQQKNDESATAA